jgi:type II secretory pathway pseudopilin PulG
MGTQVRWTARLRRCHTEAGTTLVELSVVVALLAVVVAPAYLFLTSSQRNQRVVDESVRQQQDARIALETFSRSLREATYPQGLSYSESSLFYAAAANDVSFYTDVGNDGLIDKVRYFLDTATSTVLRTVTVPDCSSGCSYGDTATSSTSKVVSTVRNADLSVCAGQSGSKPLFEYFSVDRGSGASTQIGSGGTIANLVEINYVSMTVVVDITPEKSPTCQSIDTAVSLRNWRG